MHLGGRAPRRQAHSLAIPSLGSPRPRSVMASRFGRTRRRGLPRRSPIRRTASPSGAEHRRAKTDRLDTWLLKHSFLGRLRGERDYCSMAAIPSLEEEEAKRPSRARENLVGERTRIGNRIKSALARLGIRGFGRPCARPRSGSIGCPRRKASWCRLTHWPSCGARGHGCACSLTGSPTDRLLMINTEPCS